MFLTAKKPQPQAAATDFNQVIARLDKEVYGESTPVGVRQAMGQATVYACVKIIAEIIAQLPILVQERQNGGYVTAEDHRLIRLISEPNDWQTQHDFLSFLVTWAELRGNSYYYKVYNGSGDVQRLLPIEADEAGTDLYPDARVRYTVHTDYGINGIFDRTRIMHHRNFGVEGYKGLSTIGSHRRGIGLAIQLERHADSAYANGMQTNKWLHLDHTLTPEQKDELERFLASFSGSKMAGKIPYFSNAELKEFKGVSATDAQYIETRKMQKQEIAGLFGVPLFLLNDTENNTTWGSGLEQISRAFVRFSLNPRLNRLKQTLHRELILDGAKRSTRIEFDTDQFTLGEFKERMEGYRSAIESGVLNANECRDIERRNPREGGDAYRLPANIQTEGESNEPEQDSATV
jgi:HK97 family phage portal protein